MDLLTTGSAYHWMQRLLGPTSRPAHLLASSSRPGANGLLFSPYLGGGEQGVLWNPHLRGSLIGLSLQHDASDIARALVEGIQFETCRCINVLREVAQVDRIVLTASPAVDTLAAQILADVIDLPVHRSPGTSVSALGAALLAMGERRPPQPTVELEIVNPDKYRDQYAEIHIRYQERFPD
jgi:xylulokinase